MLRKLSLDVPIQRPGRCGFTLQSLSYSLHSQEHNTRSSVCAIGRRTLHTPQTARAHFVEPHVQYAVVKKHTSMSTQSALKTLNRSSSSRALRISRVLGMKDTLSERESVLQQHIIHTAQQAALNYGAYRITTPIVEKTALYTRTLGEQTDVVQKEMFTWMDEGRNGEKQASLCLRPEGTAGTVRAFIQGHNHLPLPLRYFYDGPMFRREKPQKGRHRQFTQIGVEFLGEDHALADVEAIAMGWAIIQQLSLQDSVTLQVHTMGTEQARQAYNDALRDYLQPRAHNLCEESQKRMAAGHYLRILDSKDRTDQYLLDQAPTLLSCATKKCHDHFTQVCAGLDALKIPYAVNTKLVRGLDYYRHTVWEFVANKDLIGSQTTVLAGGRYSDLVRELGGTDISGVGWAGGVERLQILIDEVHPNYVQDNGLMRTSEVAVCSLDGAASHVHCLRLTQTLRAAGYRTVFNPSKSHYKQLGAADTAGCQYALLIGKDEVEGSSVCIKDLRTSEQTTIPLHDAVTWIGHQQPLK